MRILVDVLHPAHVHFFRAYIVKAQKRGDTVFITTRNKEITDALLDRYGLSYRHISTPAGGKVGQLFELLSRWMKLAWITKSHQIDVAMSISGLCTGFSSWICGVPNVAFTDTEDATLSNKLALPFCTYFVTPEFYLQDMGVKHVRYRGLHETAYLKNFDFTSAETVRRELKLPERYVIMRLVANDALHDEGIKGIALSDLDALIAGAERLGAVYITSQAGLPERYSRYRLKIPIEQIHGVLAGAMLYVGDSPTMAVESSVLGTPAFLLTSRWERLGNMVGLERDHQLLRNFSDFNALRAAIREIHEPLEFKRDWEERARGFRDNVEDGEALIERLVQQAISRKGAAREQPA